MRTENVPDNQDSYVLNNLEVCTSYQIVIRAATCADEATSDAVSINVEDITKFDLILEKNDGTMCTDFIRADTSDVVTMIEDAMRNALLINNCGSSSVTCFSDSTLECSREDPNNVYFRLFS